MNRVKLRDVNTIHRPRCTIGCRSYVQHGFDKESLFVSGTAIYLWTDDLPVHPLSGLVGDCYHPDDYRRNSVR